MKCADTCMYRFGAQAVKHLPQILSHPVFMRHVKMHETSAALDTILSARATSVLFAYFPSNVPHSVQSGLVKEVEGVLDTMRGMSLCVAFGWGVETDFPVLGGKDGETGAAFAVFVALDDVESDEGVGPKQLVLMDGVKEVLVGAEGLKGVFETIVKARRFGAR